MEDKGYTVELTEFSEWGIAYAALAKGTCRSWSARPMRGAGLLEPQQEHGLYRGIAVPKYVPIVSIEQLSDNADKFGGKIIGIEPGAGLMREAADAVDAYGMKLQLVEGSPAAMTATLKSAVDRQDWIAVTLWEPT
ncbi:glycine betaine ABC transporter substrate-binding protein [Paracoccus sp. N5]|uniref:glycine betaine ABC transporter substrate-binding protein n=1 Tax=Paracoccus sp. N5 TaxID=1101189 RepID=UPI000685ED3E|nr:glycine betaine ABC transporter substrate-binding protein [Paracoccus sp. N5]